MYSSLTNTRKKTRQFSRSGTFADLLVRHVRSHGGAPAVYTAARIDRRTYSSIISNPFRPVAKVPLLPIPNWGLKLDICLLSVVFCPRTKDRRRRTKDLGHWTLDGRVYG